MSKENSSPSFMISPDKMTVSNPKGYSIARGSFGISEGTLFFEVDITGRGPCPFTPPPEPHIRLGVAMSQAEAEAPVGYDYFGFCYRDLDGSTFSQSRRKDYGRPFHVGDTVGVLLELPPIPPGTPEELVKVLKIPGSKATGRKPPNPLPVHPGSKLSFFVNGEPQGVAYSNFHRGTYYPAVSSYMGAQARFNFGPEFKYPLVEENVRSAYEVGIELGKMVSERLERERVGNEPKKGVEVHSQHEKRHKKAGSSDVTPVRTPSPANININENNNGNNKEINENNNNENNDNGNDNNDNDKQIKENNNSNVIIKEDEKPTTTNDDSNKSSNDDNNENNNNNDSNDNDTTKNIQEEIKNNIPPPKLNLKIPLNRY